MYVADYLADTSRLTTEQHGAYMLLIMDYWRNGPPPNDEAVLSSITRLPIHQWRKHSPFICLFFCACDGKLMHKRIDEERSKASEISTKRTTAAQQGAAKRWGKEMPNAMPNGMPNGMPNAMPNAYQNARQNDAPSPSPNTSPIGDGRSEPSSDPEPDEKFHCPHQEIISLYHEKLPTAIRIRSWTPARAQALRSRWNEKTNRQNTVWWGKLFEYIEKSDFLMGRAQSGNRRPFEVSLEWICKAANFTNIIEGKYHEKEDEEA